MKYTSSINSLFHLISLINWVIQCTFHQTSFKWIKIKLKYCYDTLSYFCVIHGNPSHILATSRFPGNIAFVCVLHWWIIYLNTLLMYFNNRNSLYYYNRTLTNKLRYDGCIPLKKGPISPNIEESINNNKFN